MKALLAMVAITVAMLAIGRWLHKRDRVWGNQLTAEQRANLGKMTERLRQNHVSGD